MKRAASAILLMLLLVTAGVITSAVSAGPPTGILGDASDGVINGSYSASQVRAALAAVRGDPAYMQYSDIEGVLVNYLASLTRAGGQGSTVSGGGGSAGGQTTSGQSGSSGQTATSGGAGQGESNGSPGSLASPAGGTTSGAQVPGASVPGVTAWDRAKVRLAAVPWFFAAAAIGIAVAAVLLRRRAH